MKPKKSIIITNELDGFDYSFKFKNSKLNIDHIISSKSRIANEIGDFDKTWTCGNMHFKEFQLSYKGVSYFTKSRKLFSINKERCNLEITITKELLSKMQKQNVPNIGGSDGIKKPLK